MIYEHSFHFVFSSCIVDMFENISKSVNILILLFYISVLLRSTAAIQFHAFCNSFMNTGYKFCFVIYYIITSFLYFTSSADANE